MKNIFIRSKSFCWILGGICILSILVSCKKYDSLGFTPGKGVPAISSVHTWNKTDTTTRYDTVITYDASGNITNTLKQKSNQLNPFDSVTTAGSLGNDYIIYGSNLGSAISVTFNGYSAYFNRALMTDQSIIVQVPSKTPYYGSQAKDSLVVTTLYGKVSYKFSILPPAPSPSGYSNYNFVTGSQITLTGVGFATVTSVALSGVSGGNANVTIISQNDSILVLQFPSTTITRGVLVFSYSALGTSKTAIATQELVDVDNAYQIFTDAAQNGWGSWSWDNAGASTKQVKSGTQSWNAQFTGGGYKPDGFRAGGGGATDGIPYSSSYTYLSFWIYGGSVDETPYIEWGNQGFGNGGGNQINKITVPANKWTYFKIPISTLLWNTSAANWAANSSQYLSTVAFLMTSNTVTEQIYFDDIILIK